MEVCSQTPKKSVSRRLLPINALAYVYDYSVRYRRGLFAQLRADEAVRSQVVLRALLSHWSGDFTNVDGAIEGIILLAIRNGLPIKFVKNVDVVDAVA